MQLSAWLSASTTRCLHTDATVAGKPTQNTVLRSRAWPSPTMGHRVRQCRSVARRCVIVEPGPRWHITLFFLRSIGLQPPDEAWAASAVRRLGDERDQCPAQALKG